MGRRMPFEVHDRALFMTTQNDAFETLEAGWSSRTRADIATSAARSRDRRERLVGLIAMAFFALALVPPLLYWLHHNQSLVVKASRVDILVTGSR